MQSLVLTKDYSFPKVHECRGYADYPLVQPDIRASLTQAIVGRQRPHKQASWWGQMVHLDKAKGYGFYVELTVGQLGIVDGLVGLD